MIDRGAIAEHVAKTALQGTLWSFTAPGLGALGPETYAQTSMMLRP
nr:hypothetical protein [Geitlerinema sp. PCC 7407]